MPIDPSIPLGVQPPRFNSPFEILGQMQQLRANQAVRQQQVQTAQALEEERRQKVEQAKRHQEELDQVNALLSQPDFTVAGFLDQVRQRVPGQYEAIRKVYETQEKTAAETKKAIADAQKAQADAVGAAHKLLGQTAKYIKADGYSPSSFMLHAKNLSEQMPEFQPMIDDALAKVKSGAPIQSVIDPLLQFADAEPLPSAPFEFSPHAYTVPSPRRASV